MIFPNNTLVIKGYAPQGECPICSKEAYEFYQVYLDGNKKENSDRKACSTGHYDCIIFKEGQ